MGCIIADQDNDHYLWLHWSAYDTANHAAVQKALVKCSATIKAQQLMRVQQYACLSDCFSGFFLQLPSTVSAFSFWPCSSHHHSQAQHVPLHS